MAYADPAESKRCRNSCTIVLERDWLLEATPAAQQRASQHEKAKMGLHMNPQGFKEAGFHCVRRNI